VINFDKFSHVGHVRERNEDTLFVRESQGLFVVCDGMGGHSSGDVASRIAAEELGRCLEGLNPLNRAESADDRARYLTAAVGAANEAVYKASCEQGRHGMGTTVVVVLLAPGAVVVAHVGDSRAYCRRDNTLRQLTVDHTLGEVRKASGDMEPGPYDHHLVHAVGVDRRTVVTVRCFATEPGDVLLLCSDGLYNEVDPLRLLELMGRPTAGEQLLAEALDAGARDNVSGIVVRL